MTTILRDTDPEALRVLDARYASMSPADKLRRVRQLSLAANRLAMAGLRSRHPEVTEMELLARLAEIRLGSATFTEVYGSRSRT